MSNEIERFIHAGRTVVIYYDEMAESPRKAFSQTATLVCWHRRADLGDKQVRNAISPKDIVREALASGDRILAILPLYLYQHSGMTMRCTPFGDTFDSGQVGWGYVSRSSAITMGCVGTYIDHETKETKTYDKAYFEQTIRDEVAEYDLYLKGECYEYAVLDDDGDVLESCCGYYGDIKYVREEAKTAAEGAVGLLRVNGGCDKSCADGAP